MTAKKAEAAEQSKAGGLAAIGQQLAAARENQQLSIENIASELHLAREVVQALEEGDESRLPAQTFVRGYIRNYARRLGLDDTELMAHFPSEVKQQTVPLKSFGLYGRRRRMHLPVGKWLLWILVLLALGLIFIYGVPLVERLISRSAAPQHDENTNSLELPLSSVPSDEQAMNGVVGVMETADTDPVMPGQTSIATPAADGELAPSAKGNYGKEDPVAELKPAGSVDSSIETGPVESVLLLRFREDSWVEVKVQGRKLMARIESAGSERTIRAVPPVDLLLGNAPAVDVIYNGMPVNTTDYQRGKVARLVLGG